MGKRVPPSDNGSHTPGTNASFDYVIVGGGTAGLTLATRLAQNGSFSVAVVEAGGIDPAMVAHHLLPLRR